MIFNDTTSEKQGIVQDVYFTVNQNSNSYPIADVTRNVNRALDKVVSLILGADGRWQFDDTNNTDLPIGTTNLVNGQIDYSFDTEYLVIKSLEISDSNNNWSRLIPIDNNTLQPDESLTDFMENGGIPQYYDAMGTSILLYPTPNYNKTNGLKAYFQRKINYFVTTDTTKEAGFAPHLHKYLSLSASYDFAIAKGLPKANMIRQEMLVKEKEIKDFYSYRHKAERRRIQPNVWVKI